ncbi:MAG: hypothetical protein GWP05_01210 [Anaerolineaceae bacterium]|nr:hypothetical protein [Anaerolineaceae bacterium]
MPNGLGAVASVGTILSEGSGRGIDEMSSMDFLKLLITQLSNQDPMEPMKSQELLEQLSAIRSLESNMTVSENFKKLLDYQELAGATLLIGSWVTGVDVNGESVEGRVERVVMDASGVRVQVGDHEIALKNIQLVGAEEVDDVA